MAYCLQRGLLPLHIKAYRVYYMNGACRIHHKQAHDLKVDNLRSIAALLLQHTNHTTDAASLGTIATPDISVLFLHR